MADVNLLEVADQVKTWANRNKGIVALAEALESIGSLDQARSEREAKLAEVAAEVEEALGKLQTAKDALTMAAEQQKGIYDAANEYSTKVRADAENAAAELMVKATADAEAVVQSAKETARLTLDSVRGDAQTWANEAKASRVAYYAAADQLAAAKDELATIQGKIADAKAAAKKLLEG